MTEQEARKLVPPKELHISWFDEKTNTWKDGVAGVKVYGEIKPVEITIAKAAPTAGEAPQDVRIEITGEPPEYDYKDEDWREKYDAFYNEQAATLGKALLESLPGATIDRMLIFMLTQKAGYFRVPYVKPHEEAHMGELLEAIAPFALLGDYANENKFDDDMRVTSFDCLSTATFGDARKLRDAVNKFLK